MAPNDNRRAAGRVTDGALSATLVAAEGEWQPEGPRSPRLRVAAFGQTPDELSTPGPLLRVREGSEVAVTIRNQLSAIVVIHGLVAHPSKDDTAVSVSPGESKTVRFNAGRAGTYHYWATTNGRPLNLRAAYDSQLSGAFIVDSPGDVSDDRIFVIGDWDDRGNRVDDTPQVGDRHVFVINGQSWPFTERLREEVGRESRWHVINISLVGHPMHLHGFFFSVDALGNGLSATTLSGDKVRRVVTQHLAAGETMHMTWIPERAGNWLFHCHIVPHISPALRFWEPTPDDHANHAVHDAAAAMTGLVMGIEVTGEGAAAATSDEPARALALRLMRRQGYWKPEDAYAFAMVPPGATPRQDDPTVPGPTLLLKRNQPVAITLNNDLPEATAIHWHGIELDSYYDGVPGFSGTASSTTPAIAPGTSLTVRFTPPRNGTFMYHTHSHDDHQLASGLYGAIIVVDDPAIFDPATDHVVMLGMQGTKNAQQYTRFPVVVNGKTDTTLTLKAGVPNRLRLANITTNFAGLNVSLSANNEPVQWRPVAKDGADLPPGAQQPQPAIRQTVSVGETFDFIVDAPAAGVWWLDVKRAAGEWVQQVRVTIAR